MEAKLLENGAERSRIYVPSKHSRLQTELSPALYSGLGKGSVWYLGDMGTEQGSLTLLLAMLEHAMSEMPDEPPPSESVVSAASGVRTVRDIAADIKRQQETIARENEILARLCAELDAALAG
ncbi:MAG: hypothetical protein Q9181_007284 [Wetmoreana brouardii]